MAFLQKTIWMFLFFTVFGGIVGGILGEILRVISPPGILHDIFLKGYHIGINPPLTIDIHMLTFTIGFTLQVNLLTLLGIILGIYTFKQA